MNENLILNKNKFINQKLWDYYSLKLESYEKLKLESDNFKELKFKNLPLKQQILINYVLSNFDIGILELKDKNFDFCFKIRNNLILSLSDILED
jgi:hypothetical protein